MRSVPFLSGKDRRAVAKAGGNGTGGCGAPIELMVRAAAARQAGKRRL
jgi:hypothetical protein